MSPRALRILSLAVYPCLAGCLTPLVWKHHGRQTWKVRSHCADLHVTRAGMAGEDLVLAFRAPRPLPSPWSAELGEAGWLVLTDPADGGGALALLRGRGDLEVRRAAVGLAADRPDPLALGPRAELVLEGSLRAGFARRLTGEEAEAALRAAAALPGEPPPVLAACMQAVRRTPTWVLAAAAGAGVAPGAEWHVTGWVGRDLLPLHPERLDLPPEDVEPGDHLAALSRIHLLLTSAADGGEAERLLVPADLAFLLERVEFRLQPVPHFLHRSRWLPSVPTSVPELRPLPVRVTLSVTTRERVRLREGGFWDTAWRVVLTPFTAVADGAIALGLGAGVLAGVLASACDDDDY